MKVDFDNVMAMAEKASEASLPQKILVIDDDLELCHVIVDTLKEKGYDATFVQSAEEGYEKAAQARPDLILLDVEVPQMGGMVLCQKMRQAAATRDIPIVFLSVRDSDFDRQTALSLGADRYITKPFRRSHLLKEIEEIFAHQKEDWVMPSRNYAAGARPPQPMASASFSPPPAPPTFEPEPLGASLPSAQKPPEPPAAVPQRVSNPPLEPVDLLDRKVEETPPAPTLPAAPAEKAPPTVPPAPPPVAPPPPSAAPPPAPVPPAPPPPEKSGVPVPPPAAKKGVPAAAKPLSPSKPGEVRKSPVPPAPPPSGKTKPPIPTKKEKGFETFDAFRARPGSSGGFKGWVAQRKKTSIAVAAALLVGMMWGSVALVRHFQQGKKEGKDAVKSPEGVVAVNVMRVQPAPFQDIMTAVGTVYGGAEIELRFQMEGKVKSLNFHEGDKVKSGQIIAMLDQTQTLIKLERARSEYYRYEKLYALGGVSKDRLDEARVQMEYAQTELDKTVLRASQDGIFGDKGVEVGEFVTPQKKVGTLVSLNSVLVRIGVIEKEIDKLFPGQPVIVAVDTYPDIEFKGKIENLSPLVQGQSKTLTVEARIPNENKLLLPGMFARTRVVIYERDSVIAVPNDALEKTPEGAKLFVVGPDSTAEQRVVEVSYVSLTHSVVSNGLQPGDQVIVHRPQELKAGSPLKVVDVEKSEAGGTPELPLQQEPGSEAQEPPQ